MNNQTQQTKKRGVVDYLVTLGVTPAAIYVAAQTGALTTLYEGLGAGKEALLNAKRATEEWALRQSWRLGKVFAIVGLMNILLGLGILILNFTLLTAVLATLPMFLMSGLLFHEAYERISGKPIPHLDNNRRQTMDVHGELEWDNDPVLDPNRSFSWAKTLFLLSGYPILLGFAMLIIGEVIGNQWIAHLCAIPFLFGVMVISIIAYIWRGFVVKGGQLIENVSGKATDMVEALGIDHELGDRKKLEIFNESFIGSIPFMILATVISAWLELYFFHIVGFGRIIFLTVAVSLLIRAMLDYRLWRAGYKSQVTQSRRDWAKFLAQKFGFFVGIVFFRIAFPTQFYALGNAINNLIGKILTGMIGLVNGIGECGPAALIYQGDWFLQALLVGLFVSMALIFGMALKITKKFGIERQAISNTIGASIILLLFSSVWMGSSAFVNGFMPGTCSVATAQAQQPKKEEKKAEKKETTKQTVAESNKENEDSFYSANDENVPADEIAEGEVVKLDDPKVIDAPASKPARPRRKSTPAPEAPPEKKTAVAQASAPEPKTDEVAQVAEAVKPRVAVTRTASIGGCSSKYCPPELTALAKEYGL